MKKLLLLLLAFCLCFCLCACSKNPPVNETTPSTTLPLENEVVTESTVLNETETRVAKENITEAKVTAENNNKTEGNTSLEGKYQPPKILLYLAFLLGNHAKSFL